MQLDLWAFDTPQPFIIEPDRWGFVLILLYVVCLYGIVRAYRYEWREVFNGKMIWYLLAAIAAILSSGLFLVKLPSPDILPLLGLSQIPPIPAVPVFGAVVLMAVGGWLGVGPAVGLGLLAGVVRMLWLSGRVMHMFEIAALAGLVSFFMRQNYRGRVFTWLRRPLVAGVIGGIAASVLAFLSVTVSVSAELAVLPALDFSWTFTRAGALALLLEWVLAGLLVELVFARVPDLRPAPRQLMPPPYEYSLTRRFLNLLIPLFVVIIAGLLVAVTRITINSATDLTLQQMAHDAQVASEAIPDLELISNNLLVRLAQDHTMLDAPESEQQQAMASLIDLEQQLQTTAFFRQLVLFDAKGAAASAYPPMEETDLPLSGEEENIARWAATLGLPRSSTVWMAEQNVWMQSEAEPILNAAGEPAGAVLGRVDLGLALQPVVKSLQGTAGAGRGFIVDDQWSVIAHPNEERLTMPWVPPQENEIESAQALVDGDLGRAYRGVAPDGSRQLVYTLDGVSHPWTVVIVVPYEQVLSLATRVATPLAGFMALAGVLLALGLVVLSRQINRPMVALAQGGRRHCAAGPGHADCGEWRG